MVAAARKRRTQTKVTVAVAAPVTRAHLAAALQRHSADLIRALRPAAETIADKLLDAGQEVLTTSAAFALRALALPVGTELPGGIYAGITTVRGAPSLLLLGPEHDNELTWPEFGAWQSQRSAGDGTGLVLPSKQDGMLLFTTLRGHFRRGSVYWLECHSTDANWAWYQDFSYGGQYTSVHTYEFRGRLVRRIPLTELTAQTFNAAAGRGASA